MRFALLLLSITTFACVDPDAALDTGSDGDALTTYGADDAYDNRLDYSQSPTAVQSDGAVVGGATHLYYIFYGQWSQSDINLYVLFAGNLSGSPQAEVLSTYYDASHTPISSTWGVTAVTDPGSQGPQLNGETRQVINQAIANGLPRDANAVYVIVPDAATQVIYQGADWCQSSVNGFHDYYTDGLGNEIKFAYVKNLSRCKTLATPTPNGSAEVDATVYIVWHEFAEALSNPHQNHDGWTAQAYKSDGTTQTEEIADLCESKHMYGITEQVGPEVVDPLYDTPNGAKANVHLGNLDWQVPVLWQNTDRGGCVDRLSLARPVAHLGTGASSATGDLDGNGIGDLVWRDSQSGQVSVSLLDANSAVIQQSVIGTLNTTFQIEAIADFNGDGRPDLLWRNVITGELRVWNLSGTSVVGTENLIATLPNTAVLKAVGDFNNDGRADVLFEDYANGGDAYRLWLDTSSSMPAFSSLPTVSIPQPSYNVETLGTGNFDGAGGADVLWRDKTNGYYYYWAFVNGAFQLRWFDGTGKLAFSSLLGIVDVDRDGVADLIGVTSDKANIAWIKPNGASLAPSTILAVPAPEWRFSGGTLIYYNNHAGLLWRNRRTGDVARWILDWSGNFAGSTHIVVGAGNKSQLVTY